jgi:glucose/arabinose dehydrogenase
LLTVLLTAVEVQAQPYADWRADAPGVVHRIGPNDLPAPSATRSAFNGPRVVERPAGAMLRVPAGFVVQAFAGGLRGPRIVQVAPNGDIFVAESAAGRIRILRAADGASSPQQTETFADGLDQPFGIAFWPPGPAPQFVYVAENNAVVRFAYRVGDLHARGGPETVVPQISPTAYHHWTRDVAFSPDGKRMFVSVGSGSNDAEDMPRLDAASIRTHDAQEGAGAAWGPERLRADVLQFTPEGKERRVFAAGLRNCVSMAVAAPSGDLWCAVNERDGVGDDLPPDYVTRVREGQFFGWPWYYVGGHEDPAHAGERRDLAGRVTAPEVLIQPHSAALGMTLYTGASFPPEYRGDAFVALHGSWNRARRTGYKVVRIHLRNGVPDGSYEDFLTGFVVDDGHVWGRPVGVAVAHDGALLVTEDGNGTIWRVAYQR